MQAAEVKYHSTARFVDNLLPQIFPKVADANPRTKSGAQSFIVHICQLYRDPVLKMVFAPIPLTGKPPLPPKMIKARIEITHMVTADVTGAPADLEVLLSFRFPSLI